MKPNFMAISFGRIVSVGYLAFQAGCSQIPIPGPSPVNKPITDITAESKKGANDIAAACLATTAEPSRPMTGILNGKEFTACLDDQYGSLVQFEKGCKILSDSGIFKFPFQVNVITYAERRDNVKRRTPAPEWACYPVISKEDKAPGTVLCNGHWLNTRIPFINRDNPSDAYYPKFDSCMEDPYDSRVHFVLSHCPELSLDTSIPLGALPISVQAIYNGEAFMVGKAPNNDLRTLLNVRCR